MHVLTADSQVETHSLPWRQNALHTVRSDLETDSLSIARRIPSFVDAAIRAHAVMSHSVPDESLDDLSAGDGADQMPFTLPPVPAG